jgi:heat shock protein HslJ
MIALLAACGDDDGSDASADDLEGRTFVADAVEGWTLVEGTEVTLTFTDGAIVASAGCNTMRGGFEIEDGVLVVDAMAQTLMACEDERQAQDQALAAFLGEGPEATLSDNVLTLTGGEVTMSATELE